MAFPVTPLDLKVELSLASVWTDITSYVYTRDAIAIDRGRPDESSTSDASTCRLTVNNRDGRFSPRNPTGPYYGTIGRNTPVRVSVRLGTTRLTGVGTASTPDSAGLSITGDLDLRFDGRLPSWDPNQVLMAKYGAAGQRSYQLSMDSVGRVVLTWSANGTATFTATSTLLVPRACGRQAVRATIDVDNGAAGRTITFYTAPTMAGTWVQLGDPVVQAGTTSIFDSTASLTVSCIASWELYSAQVYQGIAGTVRANPDFSIQAEAAGSFADAAGNTWTIPAGLTITNRRVRFSGEVSTWPSRWGLDGADVWASVVGSGIQRRISQGATPLQSSLRRGVGQTASVVSYWPLEDLAGSTSFATTISGAAAMTYTGAPDIGSDDSFDGSAALPNLNSASFSGTVPAATPGTIQARCVWKIPAGGEPNNAVIMRVYTTGTVDHWDLLYTTGGGGTVWIQGLSAAGAVLCGPLFTHTGINGTRMQASMNITTVGADVQFQLVTVNIDVDAGLQNTGTLAAATVGMATRVVMNANLAAVLADTVVGHPHTLSVITANQYILENYVRAWVPEAAGRRVQRLCTEEGIPFTAYGILGPAAPTSHAELLGLQGMGAQSATTVLDVVTDAAFADGGFLMETREVFALGYRTRESLYNQAADLALTYASLAELEPVDDDQQTRNDITTTRAGGSSARRSLATGALSTQAPPNGVGVYAEDVTINIELDNDLFQQASWRLNLGTVDETRYPRLTLDLATAAFAGNTAQTSAALDLDQGDRFTVTGLPAWLPPDMVSLLAQGFREELTPYGYQIEISATPESPYRVLEVDSATYGRLDALASTLNASITTSATSVVVTGDLWITTADRPGDFPFDIVVGGEAMTVSACTGATSPQTFTVTRSVNGVVKAHSAGAAVHVRQPVVLAL